MEDLPLGRIAALVPEFAVKDLPLGRTLMMMMNSRVGRILVQYTKVTRCLVLTGMVPVPFLNLLSQCPEKSSWDASLSCFVEKLKFILHFR